MKQVTGGSLVKSKDGWGPGAASDARRLDKSIARSHQVHSLQIPWSKVDSSQGGCWRCWRPELVHPGRAHLKALPTGNTRQRTSNVTPCKAQGPTNATATWHRTVKRH